jgi:hypothetical protein
MPRLIPSAERILRARELIERARRLPIPEGIGRNDLGYIAQVKDLLRQARDLVKFIPQTPTATAEMKTAVKEIYAEAERVDRELLR